MKTIILLCFLTLLAGCTNNRQFKDLETGIRYSLFKDKQRLLSFEAPIGSWNNLRNNDQPKDKIARKLTILNGRSPFVWVGYEARLGMQNAERFAKKVDRLQDALETGDMLKSVNRKIREFYTEKWRKEVGVSEVSGSLINIGEYACTQIDETQELGPDINDPEWGDTHVTLYRTFISCPLIIEGEIWELISTHMITISTNRFNRHYGNQSPSIADIRRDIRARLQPMHDSIIVYRNPSQKLPEGYKRKEHIQN